MRKAFSLTGVFLLVSAAAAQLRVDVRLVNVVATVTDSLGRYVEGLEASDFTLVEDGIPQQISHFAASRDLPVSVGIVLDTSTSMERKILTATRAVDRFLRDIHADDDIFLMTFDNSVRVRQDFTSNRDKLGDALDKVRLSSGTALYDAVIEATDKVRKGKHSKKAILLISDGVDTSSDHDVNVARIAVRESEVLLYALGIAPEGRSPLSERPPVLGPGGGTTPRFPAPSPIPGVGSPTIPIPMPGPGRRQFPGGSVVQSLDSVDMSILNAFADASGGKAWLITPDTRRNRLQDALDEIADELRSQYTLGYYPGHSLTDGKWHRIELTLKNPDYHVRYKKDYLAK
ncbi:MAG TPA: VWA domain-containing protein [Terriglobia bacterium]|nr:VWA domain-containing protein [Terriglobia bacterium]